VRENSATGPQTASPLDQPAGTVARRGPPADQGHRALPGRDLVSHPGLGRHGPRHRGGTGARPDAARSSRGRRPHRRPIGPADGRTDRL